MQDPVTRSCRYYPSLLIIAALQWECGRQFLPGRVGRDGILAGLQLATKDAGKLHLDLVVFCRYQIERF
jgi:hypothetical protein